jgi:gamma-glutamyltranspeptidase/glutathione hydrolase
VADLSFMGIDAAPLVDADYLRNRAATLGTDVRYTEASSGRPYGDLSYASDDAFELDSTSHIAIVDKQGNAVSMTSSIEFMFGSGIMVDGFLLNNQLTDFAINPIKDGVVVLNAAAPGKRPRSAMSPTMVFTNDGELNLIVGSPGGSRIINYVAQTIINVLDFNLDIQESIDVARITNRNDFTSLEKGTNISQLKAPLEALGHTVRVVDLNSGLHGIQIENGKLLGGADPRREGIAIGK